MVGLVSFISCLLARWLAFDAPVGVIFWPGAAVAFAFGWRFGMPWILPAAAGAALWALFGYNDWQIAAVAALTCLPGPLVAISMLRRLNAWKPADYRLEAVLRFVTIIALIAAPLDALLATLAFGNIQMLADMTSGQVFPSWWLLDSLGMLMLTPALLAWINDDQAPEPEAGIAHEILVDGPALVLTTAVVAASLGLSTVGQGEWGHTLMYFYFPIVAWTSVRMSERATALSLLVTAVPLLAARAFQVHTLDGPDVFRVLESAVIILCAILVALIMQAVAADRRFALARVARQARQDLSTGLLNDRGLLAELGDRLVSPNRTHYGLVGVHLTNFDALNDLCGPMQALQLEQTAATVLLRQPGALIGARLSSGRYALLLSAETVAQVRALAREIYAQLNGQVFKIEHGSLRLQVSVGGLLVDRYVQINSEDCLMSLSDAMAIAASVRDPQLFVEPLSQTMVDARRAHQGKLEHIREAICEQRFDVHAQPIVDPDAPPGALSYEVLVRLRDRDGGLIRPPEFLPLAVQAQMTVALDRGVIRTVFAYLATHPDALARTHKCSINLSGMTMSDGTIASFIREQRARYNIPSQKIVFEITEGEAIRNPGAASRLVDDLKSDGFGIALDDFGTGLATFEYLKRFPLDYLKIDGTFIRNLVSNPIDEEIVLATIRVARRLNVKTIAEHVHSQEIYDRLRVLGIEYVQGELISIARPIAELFENPPTDAQQAATEAGAALRQA
ncbi:MAG: EAL domain-containing protein [Burkholderiaceae bacterium]